MIDVIYNPLTGSIYTISKLEQNTENMLPNWVDAEYFEITELPSDYMEVVYKVDVNTKQLIKTNQTSSIIAPLRKQSF